MDGVTIQHIEKTPGVCGGRACIAGHRVRVQDVVVWHEKRGYSPDEIVKGHKGVRRDTKVSGTVYLFNHSSAARFDAISTVE